MDEKLRAFDIALTEAEALQYSPLALAFLGDAVYEILIRTGVVLSGSRAPKELFHLSSREACAPRQALRADLMQAHLTGTEEAVYKRGRNAHSKTMAKNASVTDYRKATGFEALMGFLYLTGQKDRILELIALTEDENGQN